MRKMALTTILVAGVGALFAKVPDAAPDRLTAPALKDCRVQGPIGAKFEKFMYERCWGPYARGVVMREAEEAFAHPDDDVFNAPAGMWKGEFWGKLALAAARVAAYRDDADFTAFLRASARRLVAHQRADGYLGTYLNPEFVLPCDPETARAALGWPCSWNWNLWCRKYTLWGLLAVYDLTGDADLLRAADRAMAQEIAMLRKLGLRLCETGTGPMRGLPPCSTLKPLLLLYRATAKPEYLAFAREIVASWSDGRGPAPQFAAKLATGQSMDAWYPGEEGRWAKAYEMMSCLDGLLEYYRLTGEAASLDLVVKMQDLIWRTERNLVESVGYNDQFVGAARHLNGTSEPCDAIHWIRLNYDLYLITGEAKYVNAIEYTYHNAFLAGVFRDGTWGAREVRSHGRHIARFGQSGMRFQHCCVNNMPRTFMDIAQLGAVREGEAVRVNLYAPFTAGFADAEVTLTGDFPIADKVTAKFAVKRPTTVKFRLPPWSKRTTFAVLPAGKPVVPPAGDWYETQVPAGVTVIKVAFDMAPRLEHSGRAACDDLTDYRFRRWNADGRDARRLYRTTPAARLFRGPLLLAKSKNVNDTADDILRADLNGGDWSVTLRPFTDFRVMGAWEATFTRGDEKFAVSVCDFPSAGDELLPDGADYFSIFF